MTCPAQQRTCRRRDGQSLVRATQSVEGQSLGHALSSSQWVRQNWSRGNRDEQWRFAEARLLGLWMARSLRLRAVDNSRLSGTGGSPYVRGLCGKMRPNRIRTPRISGHVRKDEAPIGHQSRASLACAERCGRIEYVRRASLAMCGKTRPLLGTKAAHLWLCAERCGRIEYVRRASVALCGRTRPHWARKAQHLWPCAERREQRTPRPGA